MYPNVYFYIHSINVGVTQNEVCIFSTPARFDSRIILLIKLRSCFFIVLSNGDHGDSSLEKRRVRFV